MKSSWLNKKVKLEFEDGIFSAPKEYVKYLETMYGDWQSLPPENERLGHGDIYFDLNNDYSLYWGEKLKAKKQH